MPNFILTLETEASNILHALEVFKNHLTYGQSSSAVKVELVEKTIHQPVQEEPVPVEEPSKECCHEDPAPPMPVNPPAVGRPAYGNPVTTGYGNLFGGTSWGA